MKLNVLLAASAATVCVLSSGSAHAFGITPTCQSYFRQVMELGIPHAPDATGEWRAKITNAQADGTIAPTSQAREEFINKAVAAQLTFMNSHEDTPEMVIIQAQGVTVSVVKKEAYDDVTPIPLAWEPGTGKQSSHYDEVPRLNVTGLGPSGVFRGTLAAPVSAHNGLVNATNWAAVDLYGVVVANANFAKTGTIVQDAPSKGAVTLQEFAIQMVPGQVIQIQYGRNKSLGVGGYAEGRVYEFVWDGK